MYVRARRVSRIRIGGESSDHERGTMSLTLAALVIIGMSSLGLAEQVAPRGADGKPATGACALLTRELAMKVSGAVNKIVFDIPPEEEPVGKTGSACHYAGITLQIDAFTPEAIDAIAKKDKEWAPVSGVADSAYYRNNRDTFAEIIGRVGKRTFTIQLSVPFQSTVEKVRPNAITLAHAIVGKLR
jgi:hypothetical protein